MCFFGGLNLKFIYIITAVISLSLFTYSSFALEVSITVVDKDNAPLKDIIVYLEPLDYKETLVTDKVIEIGQMDKSFIPYVSVMQTGSSVLFHNQDDITHHIYSPVGDNKFAFKIRSGEQYLKSNFTDVGEISMGCNIHDWMSGHLLIVDTPFFNKSDDKGVVNISVVKAGQYRLTIWHPQLSEREGILNQLLHIDKNIPVKIKLTHSMKDINEQKNDDDFDFLSDY